MAAVATPPRGPIRVHMGESDQIPNVCGGCGAPTPQRSVVLRLRRPVLQNGAIRPRTLRVPIGYCADCYRRLRRFDPAVRLGWTLALVVAALLLLAQLGLPRSDHYLTLRAILPWAALASVGLAGLFAVWAGSLMTARPPVRLIDFGATGFTLAFDREDVARRFDHAVHPLSGITR